MDGGEENIRSVKGTFADQISSGRLKLRQVFITKANINQLIRESGAAPEPDLLSIDIDGNDYWVWEALDVICPRVVVIEYNATFRPPHRIVQEYQPDYHWKSNAYFGASLKALEELGTKKGYCLVGCNFTGINAFFIRQDLVQNHFSEPFTAEHHYREAMYDAFVRGYSRHEKAVGRYRIL